MVKTRKSREHQLQFLLVVLRQIGVLQKLRDRLAPPRNFSFLVYGATTAGNYTTPSLKENLPDAIPIQQRRGGTLVSYPSHF